MPNLRLSVEDVEHGDLADLLHEWTANLAVTFDDPERPEIAEGYPVIEFTGEVEDLTELVYRYEVDDDLRRDLVSNIRS